MEQRRELRLVLNQSVNVTILGKPEMQRTTGRVKNTSGRGLGLELAYPVSVGCALKIELEDAILLGEAMYCRGENGCYFVGIELEQSLSGLSELSRMVRAFAEEYTDREDACDAEHDRDGRVARVAGRWR